MPAQHELASCYHRCGFEDPRAADTCCSAPASRLWPRGARTAPGDWLEPSLMASGCEGTSPCFLDAACGLPSCLGEVEATDAGTWGSAGLAPGHSMGVEPVLPA
jgi:hypothetical protein